MTKIAPVRYVPGATSPDWDAALQALPVEVADWLQIRIGQAATGYPTSDDVWPICQGRGENGKTTFFGAIRKALGDHGVIIPEKVLMSNPGDHPTELMTLRGARLALIEETPGAAPDVKRSGRGGHAGDDRALHPPGQRDLGYTSLFITTNYHPVMRPSRNLETALPVISLHLHQMARYGSTASRFAGRPGGSVGQHGRCCLIVEGAGRWFANDRILPAAPMGARGHRRVTDVLHGYVNDRLFFGPMCVMATELYQDFKDYLNSMAISHGPTAPSPVDWPTTPWWRRAGRTSGWSVLAKADCSGGRAVSPASTRCRRSTPRG